MTAIDQPIDDAHQDWEGSADEEFAPQRRRRFPLVTGVLTLLAVAGGAFLAGVQVQKHHDRSLVTTTSAASTTGAGGTARGAAGQRARTASGAGGGGGAGLGGATVGQVKLVDGSTIYVTDASGNTITVATTASSRFTKQNTATLKDVQPGDTVVVRGAQQNDGSVSAATVSDSGPGGTPGAGGRLGGRGSGAGGAGGTGGAGAGAGGN